MKRRGKLEASQSTLPEPAIKGGKKYTTKKKNSASQPKSLSISDAAPDIDDLYQR